MPILFANGFAPIYNLIRTFFADGYTFFQSCATIAFPSIIAYIKLENHLPKYNKTKCTHKKQKVYWLL